MTAQTSLQGEKSSGQLFHMTTWWEFNIFTFLLQYLHAYGTSSNNQRPWFDQRCCNQKVSIISQQTGKTIISVLSRRLLAFRFVANVELDGYCCSFKMVSLLDFSSEVVYLVGEVTGREIMLEFCSTCFHNWIFTIITTSA